MWSTIRKTIIEDKLRDRTVHVSEAGGLHVDSGETYHIFEGQCYIASYYWEPGLNVVQDLLFITPDNTDRHPYGTNIVSTLGVKYQAYQNSVISDPGTPMTRSNKDLVLGINGSDCLAYHTPTVTDVGTLAFTTAWGSANKIGGSGPESTLLFAPNTTYLFRVTSLAAGNRITYQMNWCEFSTL